MTVSTLAIDLPGWSNNCFAVWPHYFCSFGFLVIVTTNLLFMLMASRIATGVGIVYATEAVNILQLIYSHSYVDYYYHHHYYLLCLLLFFLLSVRLP